MKSIKSRKQVHCELSFARIDKCRLSTHFYVRMRACVCGEGECWKCHFASSIWFEIFREITGITVTCNGSGNCIWIKMFWKSICVYICWSRHPTPSPSLRLISLSLSLSLSLSQYIYQERDKEEIHIYIYIYIVIGPKRKISILKWVGPRRDLYFFRIYLFISFLNTCMFPAYCFRQRTYMAQGLVNGVLNKTYGGHSSFFFLDCVYLSLLYPLLVFDKWYVFVVMIVSVC